MIRSQVATVEVLQLPHVTLFDPVKKKSTHDLVSDILHQGPSETGSAEPVSPSSPKQGCWEASCYNAHGPGAVPGGLGFQWVLQLCELSKVRSYCILLEKLLLLDS